MRHKIWHETRHITLAIGERFIQPMAEWEDCSTYLNAFLLALIDYFNGGTILLALQSCPIGSLNDAAWVDVATASVTGTGPKVLQVTKGAANPITGKLRLKATCSGADTRFNLRSELLLKEQVESLLIESWLPSTLLDLVNLNSRVMDADLWLDCSRFSNAFGICEYYGTNGGNLRVALQTAPDFSMDAIAWQEVTYATMGSSAAVLTGRMSGAIPPMGALRLNLSATGTLTGSLQTAMLLKA